LPNRLHIAHLPTLLAERRSSAVFGMVIIAMLWAGIALKYAEDIRGDLQEAERTNQTFARVFEENVLRSIGEIDKSLLYLRRSIETRKGSADYSTIVNTTDVLSEIIVQMAIIDAHGIMRASNIGPQPAPATDLSDREHFLVHVGSKEDLLFISKPVIGRISGKWSVQFSRRFLDSDGSFDGVVVASLDPAHFTKFYDNIDLGSAASISLIGDDGVVRSSGGTAGGFPLGQDLTGTGIYAQMLRGANATFAEADPATHEPLLVSIRKVRGHPLWVSVSTNENDIYRGSLTTLRINMAAGLVLTLLTLAATERILRTEARARQKAEELQRTLENMSQGIMLVTKDLQIPIINRRCGELLDLPAAVIEHPPRYDRLFGAGASPIAPSVDQNLAAGEEAVAGNGTLTVYERRMPSGTVIEIRSGKLPDGGFVQTFTDITKRCEAEAHVARLASEDPLTGLPNRRVLRTALEQICARLLSDEVGERREFAVLFLDLDRFKFINDTLGHRIGDLLLQQVARRLRSSLRDIDVLARLGGDEFAILVPAFESLDFIDALADKLAGAVAKPYEIDGYQIRSGISIGIAVGPHDGMNADELLVAADLALYAVKSSGRNAHKFYQSTMTKDLANRRRIEIDLREAIEKNELTLAYQPIISLKSNAVVGFEALVRWQHPSRGVVQPSEFIAVAEDSGLILPLGHWVLAEACRQAALWPGDLKIAVNLSPVQFSDSHLLDKIKQVLADTGLAPQRLELEITERIFMDSEVTLSMLRALKELGIRISMDDFGTGYSSLSYLRSFPFDKIKVDRAFVSDLDDGTEHIVIVQAVCHIASALGMTTTAEGVETAEQRQFLEMLGCDEAQGNLFSAPVPIEKVPDILTKWGKRRTRAA
jgi:diguanylate cyclase (GGDEF)-like protein